MRSNYEQNGLRKKTVSRGSDACFQQDITLVSWRDNKGVYAASNVHALSNENNPDKTVKRYSRIEKKSIIVPIPYLLHQYNQYIGGVDLLDMMVATYRISFRKKSGISVSIHGP